MWGPHQYAGSSVSLLRDPESSSSALSRVLSVLAWLPSRLVRGSRKWIPGSDPKDLDFRSVRIIDPTLTVCRQIHWDHRSSFAVRQEILSDPRSKTPYCIVIHRDPISDQRNSRIFYALFLGDLQRFSLKYKSNMHCHMILLILYPEIA